MASYAGLDVSQKATQICILEATGAVRWTGKTRSLGRGAAAARASSSGWCWRAALDLAGCAAA